MKHTECYQKDYPRPQFVRRDWRSLNGQWDFRFDSGAEGEHAKFFAGFEREYRIEVPFSYETKASGIDVERSCPCVWYQKNVSLTEEELSRRVILMFEGVDYCAKVWVNGVFDGRASRRLYPFFVRYHRLCGRGRQSDHGRSF